MFKPGKKKDSLNTSQKRQQSQMQSSQQTRQQQQELKISKAFGSESDGRRSKSGLSKSLNNSSISRTTISTSLSANPESSNSLVQSLSQSQRSSLNASNESLSKTSIQSMRVSEIKQGSEEPSVKKPIKAGDLEKTIQALRSSNAQIEDQIQILKENRMVIIEHELRYQLLVRKMEQVNGIKEKVKQNTAMTEACNLKLQQLEKEIKRLTAKRSKVKGEKRLKNTRKLQGVIDRKHRIRNKIMVLIAWKQISGERMVELGTEIGLLQKQIGEIEQSSNAYDLVRKRSKKSLEVVQKSVGILKEVERSQWAIIKKLCKREAKNKEKIEKAVKTLWKINH